jgi:hypothetical protein
VVEGEGETAGSTSAPRTGGLAASEASDGGTGHTSALAPHGIQTLGDYLILRERYNRMMMEALIATFPWWARVGIRISFAPARLHIAIGKFIGRLR